jgi:hypothetical protein
MHNQMFKRINLTNDYGLSDNSSNNILKVFLSFFFRMSFHWMLFWLHISVSRVEFFKNTLRDSNTLPFRTSIVHSIH